MAQWLRHPDGQARLVKMMADPQFQAEAKETAEKIKVDGQLPNFLTLEYYAERPLSAKEQETAEAIISQARDADAAFQTPTVGRKRAAATRKSNARMGGLDELQENPSPPQYWDPLNLATQEFWGQSNEATIGFLRHAEIKHGRVAMAGFIGYCIHENGIHWPWAPFNSGYEGLSAPAVWDTLPQGARLQI